MQKLVFQILQETKLLDGSWVKNNMQDKDKKIESLHLKLIPYFEKYGILLLLVLMILVMHILQPDVFLSWRNVTNVFKQISWQSMLALGVFMVIVTAGIDLSVGSIMMLSLMILAVVAKAGAPWFIVVLTPLIAGFLCGLFNGLGTVSYTHLTLPTSSWV